MGLLIDLGGTIFGGIVVGIFYGVILSSRGLSPEEVEQAFAGLTAFSGISLLLMAWGFLMSFLGGYFCIMISNGKDFVYPSIQGAIATLIGISMSWDNSEIGVTLLLGVLSFCVVLFGARTALGVRLAGGPNT